MNPILIVISAALIFSALSISLINKPKIPVVAGAMLIVLIFFVVTTFFIDNAITDVVASNELSGFVRFTVMNDSPTYEELESSFSVFSCVDIGLFLAALFAMFAETLTILRHNSKP